MDNTQSLTPQIDITETIKTIRTLITKECPDDLDEQLLTLMDYIFDIDSLSALNKDKQLRQQIADCLLLAGKQILAMYPNRYKAHFSMALSHFLNCDVRQLCQNLTTFYDGWSKDDERPLTVEDCFDVTIFFYYNLVDKVQKTFLDFMISTLEKYFPETAATYYVKSLDAKRDKEQCLHYLSKAIELESDFYYALEAIAVIYYNDKNWKNAILYYNRVIDRGVVIGEINAETYFDLAWCYGKIKDYDNEITFYKKCLDLDPEYPFALNNLGWAYQKSKDYSNALSYYQQSIKLDKDGVNPYHNTVELLKKLKRYDEAFEFLEANKKRFSKSYQNEVDELREIISKNIPQHVLPDFTDSDIEAIAEPQTPKRSSKTTHDTFLAESRLEDEIEAQICRGIPFCNLPLKIYDKSDGYGRQYMTPGIGRIDVLAVNTSNDDLYVIELKRGLSDDEVVGQVSRYMGWVKKNLATSGQNVYGIICVSQASDKLKYAADANPNISVFNYSLQITPA